MSILKLHYHGVEIICDEALAGLNFTNFTCPPLVTTITEGMLTDCKCMFSVEIPEHVTHIRSIAFLACHSLHNVAFVVAEIIEGAFLGCTDLLHVFGTGRSNHTRPNEPIHQFTKCVTCYVTTQ